MGTADTSPPRVLVVDDDRLIRELVRDAISDRAAVECCENADVALAALHREPAELVISDLQMPGLTGMELLDEVRRSHPNTAFVLLTGDATNENAVRARQMGAADSLTKPIHGDELALVVDRILAQRHILEENEKLRDTLRIIESCRSLLRCGDPGEVYSVALDLLLQNLPRQRGIALFFRSSIPNAHGVAFRGFDEQQARSLRDVLIGQKPIDIRSISQLQVVDRGVFQEALEIAGVSSGPVVAVPIAGNDVELGVLWLFEDGRQFDAIELERARLIAAYGEIALQNSERYARAKERAFIDDVTEVYNARYLLEATDNEIRRAERSGNPLTVLFLDLDRFKLVNDRYGHLVGSRALRRLSEVLKGCIRQVDTLARYGGDEFTILLIDTPHEDGLAVAERIRTTVASTLFESGLDSPFQLSISIGVATYPTHAQTRNVLLDQSDKAMYRAKSRGRDCVCSANELSD